MTQTRVGGQIAWITGGLLFGSTIIGIICNRSTVKVRTTDNNVYNYTDSQRLKLVNTAVHGKTSEPLKQVKAIHEKKLKSSSTYNIHSPRKIREREIMSHMNKYFPDKTISVQFVAFNRADA